MTLDTIEFNIEPFENCPALDGYHCQSNSLAKIFHHYRHPLSEEMLLGLGSGMGFIYWHMKGNPDKGIPASVFVGGRGNTKEFFSDVGKGTGVDIQERSTSSEKRAEAWLLEMMHLGEPAMVYGDMAYLPWFEMPEDYHFGGHTFVVCGYDGKETCLGSDMDQRATGRKKGFYHPITLEQLRKARGSKHKPFPAKNTYLVFDFSGYRDPRRDDILAAINKTTRMMLEPPIKNMGVKGLRKTSKEILKWPSMFDDHDLRMNLFNLYVFIEIGGTGGGSFRYVYSRFLEEVEGITEDLALSSAARKLYESGRILSEIGNMFSDMDEVMPTDLDARLEKASNLFVQVAEIEEGAFSELRELLIDN
jgi:hypothetical protein